MNEEEYEYKRQEIVKAFKNIFEQGDGALVLKALKSEFYDVFIPDDIDELQAMRLIGRRDVIYNIIDILEQEVQADG